METVKLARMAMATRFELVVHGDDPVWLRAVGEEALREIDRLDAQLSFYRPTSDVTRLNAEAYERPVPVDARLFDLLVRARELWKITSCAFDLTVGPLMRCWGLTGLEGRVPTADEVAEAMQRSGMHLVELDASRRSVRFLERGVEIDLGGIGKGFAVDEAVRIMRDAGVVSALIHGGTSTVAAIGASENGTPWKVAIGAPQMSDHDALPETGTSGLANLLDDALSVSDVGGKWFEADGVRYGHVIDPRTGWPSGRISVSAVAATSAADADALSTALLVASDTERSRLRRALPDIKLLVMDDQGMVLDTDFTPLHPDASPDRESIAV